MINCWDFLYKNAEHRLCFGNHLSYEKAALFLDGLSIEDWGCGTCYAEQFFKNSIYIGIDGTKNKWADVFIDLQEYKSQTDGILMRHVLEHNINWTKILRNAVDSFTKKMVLITFLNFTKETVIQNYDENGIPNITLGEEELLGIISNFLIKREKLSDGEEVFYLEKS